MKRRHLMMGGIAALGVSACTTQSSKFKTYHGPPVTFVVVNKEARRMYLMNQNDVLKSFDIDLGFAPIGNKYFEGDGRTPEGTGAIRTANSICRLVYHTRTQSIAPRRPPLASHRAVTSLSTAILICTAAKQRTGHGVVSP
jgi:hypothetical protein